MRGLAGAQAIPLMVYRPVFAKTRMHVCAEISWAVRAMARCQQEAHTAGENDQEGSP